MNSTCAAVSPSQTLLTLVTTLINTRTPADLRSPMQLRDGAHYDFIVVGAGTSGCVVASRLSEKPDIRVLLLEAGGDEPFPVDVPGLFTNSWDTRVNWGYYAQPGVICGGNPCPVVRGKMLGGCGSINAMMYNRGNRRDYDYWEYLGNKGWSYKCVLEYFKKSENNLDEDISRDRKYHSVGGLQPVERFPYRDNASLVLAAGLRESGFKEVDINGRQQTGFTFVQATQENGARVSTYRAFIERFLRKRKNLTVVSNVRVTKILIHPENKTAYGIEYALENNRTVTGRIYADKEVIVSGGAVNSPQLLMLSGIGPAETLNPLGIQVIKDSKVGANLMDHARAPGVFFQFGEYKPIEFSDLLNNALQYSEPRRTGPWSATGANIVIAYSNTRYADTSIDWPDIQILAFEIAAQSEGEQNQLVFYPVFLRPESRGNITINSTDPFAHPLIYTNYFSTDKDINAILDAFAVCRSLGNTTVFKENGYVFNDTYYPTFQDFKTGNNPYWRLPSNRYRFSHFHLSGTCKMGPESDPDAVVDPTLKVHGVERLRVIDLSIIPNITSGNTNAPAIMIAEKGADMIKLEWDLPDWNRKKYSEYNNWKDECYSHHDS